MGEYKTGMESPMDKDLEAIAGHLDPFEKMEMAEKLRRWTEQLEIAAGHAVIGDTATAGRLRLDRN